jgi:FkbM family methyltransferase
MNQELKDILDKNGVTGLTLADVGAKDGLEFIPELSGITTIHAFEPNPHEYKKLQEMYKDHSFKSLHLNETGLGETNGVARFTVTNHASMSSLLEPDMDNYEKHFGTYQEFNAWKNAVHTSAHISIKLQTSDDYFKSNAIDYLKLDTQGSELSILKGAKNLLSAKKIQVIKVEVSTIPIYKEQAVFSDIDIFLRNNNYILVDFITYRNEYIPLWNPGKAHVHHAPCGDAIYVLEDKNTAAAISLKKGILLHWLGYPAIANVYFTNAGLSKGDLTAIKHIRPVTDTPFYKRLIRNIIPPVIYRMLLKIRRA